MPIVEETVQPDKLYDQHHEYGCGNRLNEASCSEDSDHCMWATNPEYNYLAYTLGKYFEDLETHGCVHWPLAAPRPCSLQ